MTEQGEFLFADGVQPELRVPHPLDDLLQEIAVAWGLPVGERVRVRLMTEAVPELSGRLELARVPDLPLDPRQPLALRVAGVTFSSREVRSWSLL